jgi:hypothetical protein
LKLHVQNNFHADRTPSTFNMADTLNYWTIASIIIGLLVLLPSIMGLFGGNKFDVKGKVCWKPLDHFSLA